MKVKIRIAEIARQNGFNHAFALQNALKCSPTMAARLWSGEFKRIDIETMVKLGELFQCSPNDLIVYESAPVAPVADKPKQKPLNGFEAVKAEKKQLRLAEKDSGKVFNHSILELSQTSSDNETLLSTVTVAARLNVSRKSVNDYIISGKLRAVKGKQNHNFIRESDLLEFIAQRGKD
jgi:DNA-binding Xre family transcriptional regulator